MIHFIDIGHGTFASILFLNQERLIKIVLLFLWLPIWQVGVCIEVQEDYCKKIIESMSKQLKLLTLKSTI
ncbi:hypothetical protein A3860_11665 [Niastella vici]|uniref:Uncharacterized protein n=1 Tax=Niastella vici TaxID=1703345 RepID=A0A1V9FFV0_9BACT|nr:hypothetical protein A3860_11665 [Niastella vici]